METYPTTCYRIANQRKCYLDPRYLGEVANVLCAAHVTGLATAYVTLTLCSLYCNLSCFTTRLN